MDDTYVPKDETTNEIVYHPIQLRVVAVREIYARTYRVLPSTFVLSPDDIKIQFAASAYDSENKTLQIDLRVHNSDGQELSEEQEEALAAKGELNLQLRVRLTGLYSVDEENFPLDMLEEWTRKGGAMTLFPYVREQVYALTARCGIRPVILPIMQMPTIKVSPPPSKTTPA